MHLLSEEKDAECQSNNFSIKKNLVRSSSLVYKKNKVKSICQRIFRTSMRVIGCCFVI